jgi:hypothetical protein
LLPAGAVAGWDLHPLESAAFPRRTPKIVIVRGALDVELRHAGDREDMISVLARINSHLEALDIPAEYRNFIELGRAAKRDFAQRLSTCLAQKISDALRPKFRGILPDERGAKHESRSGSASGLKKLDVNYSNPQIGLGLAVSIKTINFKDERTRRFTKNIKRLDGELRAEAQDCHARQPYAVLAGLIFFPEEAAYDSGIRSSLRHAWEVFERRGGRRSTNNEASLFERIWICVYDSGNDDFGRVRCFDIADEIPTTGLPEKCASLSSVVDQIERMFGSRNKR